MGRVWRRRRCLGHSDVHALSHGRQQLRNAEASHQPERGGPTGDREGGQDPQGDPQPPAPAGGGGRIGLGGRGARGFGGGGLGGGSRSHRGRSFESWIFRHFCASVLMLHVCKEIRQVHMVTSVCSTAGTWRGDRKSTRLNSSHV